MNFLMKMSDYDMDDESMENADGRDFSFRWIRLKKQSIQCFFNGIYLSCSLKLGSHLEFSIPVFGSFKAVSIVQYYIDINYS